MKLRSAVLPFAVAALLCLPLLPERGKASAFLPDAVLRGGDLRGDLRLAGVPAGAVVRADLHWFDSRGIYRSYLASARSVVSGGSGSFAFEIPVPDDSSISQVMLVAYASADGGWETRTVSARFPALPVAPAPPSAGSEPPPRAWTRSVPEAAPILPRGADPSFFRWIAGALWLAAAAAAGRGPRRWAFSGLALWTASGAGEAAAAFLRAGALDAGLWETRRTVQAVAAAAAALGCAAAAAVLRSRSGGDAEGNGPRRIGRAAAGAAACLAAALAALEALSPHGTDALLGLPVFGVRAGRWLEAAAALAAAAGSYAARPRPMKSEGSTAAQAKAAQQ